MPEAESKAVVAEIQGGVGLCILNRPEQRNAMTLSMLEEFGSTFRALESRPEVRVIVVTGAGQAFSAGADFSAIPELVARQGGDGPAAMLAAVRALYDTFLCIYRCVKPTIAAVNGAAIGGGLGIALLCDMRIFAEGAKISANFSRLGIHPGLGISHLLPRLIGYEAAMRLLCTGSVISGAQAVAMGLGTEAVPADEVVRRACAIGHEIAAAAPLAVRMIKASLRASYERGFEESLQVEAQAQVLLGQTKDANEGIRALLEKRTPVFEGK